MIFPEVPPSDQCIMRFGYIQAEFLEESLRDGRMIESGALFDSEGKLVARSRQLGLVMARG